MSFSRLIIEQRLADMELALKRQEELIVSQRDAIRNLRDLINIDQQAQQHPANVAMDMALSAHSHAYGTLPSTAPSAPSAPMSLPRPSSFTNLNPNFSNADGNISINNITNPSFLGQRSYASYYTENQNSGSSLQDITSMSFLSSNQGNSSSAVKRARIENTAAPVAPSLKRRRALEKLRQLSPVFPSLYSVASRGNSNNISSTQQQNTSTALNTSATSGRTAPVTQHPSPAITALPPPTAPTSLIKKTPPSSVQALPAPSTTMTNQKPSSTSTAQQASLPNPSQKLVPTSLPMAKKGFNYGGVETAAITPAATNNLQITAKERSSFSSSQHADQIVSNNTSNNTSNAANTMTAMKPMNVSLFGNHTVGGSTMTGTKPAGNPTLPTNLGPVGSAYASPPTGTIATNAQNAVTVTQTTTKASTNMIDLTSINAASTSENSNTNRVSPVFKPNVPTAVTSKAITPITERVSRYKDEFETMDKADSILTKCDYLRALPDKLQVMGATVSNFLTEGGKDKCLQWLRKLEEENEELNIEGIVLLDLILSLFGTQTKFSRDEVFTTRIDKLLRRIYKKYTAQKLSLGEPLLSKIRNLWAEYRALFKEAAGDDAND